MNIRRAINILVAGALLLGSFGGGLVLGQVQPALALSSTVVISQVYGGGGNSGATYRNDFIELLNLGSTPIDLAGWSVQYAAAAGTSWQVTALSGTLQPGHYYLIQEAQGAGGTTNLPAPDATGTIPMSATAGKVALVNTSTALTGSCPTGATIIDFIGFGTTANCFEGAAPAPAPSNTTADLRAGNGATETDRNNLDFAAGAPAPRNSGDTAPSVSSVIPLNGATNAAANASLTVNFSEPVNVTGAWFQLACSASGTRQVADFAITTAGFQAYTLNPNTDFTLGETCVATISAAQVTDQDANDPPDAMAGDYTWNFTVASAVSGCSGLFFSEYVEGSSSNKALEIFNGTGAAIDLTGYQLLGYFNGGTAPTSLNLVGTVANGDVFVVAFSSAAQAILAVADQTSGSTVMNFNGDDTIVLRDPGGQVVDVIGQIENDPGTEWGTGLMSTADNSLRRKAPVSAGDANPNDAFDPADQWDGYATDDFSDLGAHTYQCRCATIPAIQGASHQSACSASTVYNIRGIVTALDPYGFYLQSVLPDSNDATSEAIFVYTNAAPTVAVGDAVQIRGTVQEYVPGSDSSNLSTTEIVGPPVVTVLSSGNPLPAPVVIGAGGRVPPNQVIEDDALASFDPAQDGIDFYESLEAMRVQVNAARVVGPSRYFASSNDWQCVIVGDNGANASVLSSRGGLAIQAGDLNPERLILEDGLVSFPAEYAVGDSFASPIVGVIGYSYGNFKLFPTGAMPSATSGGLAAETTIIPRTSYQLRVATMNLENLDPSDGARFDVIASAIVTNLNAPDIIGVEEIQDNDGETNSGAVAAEVTFNTLITAIANAGGPAYDYRQINPVNNQDGGAPGGNIRVGFLFRTDRVSFAAGTAGGSTQAVAVTNTGGAPHLSLNPGRIDPANAAFNASRKPLVGEFLFNGETIFVVVNHLNSKGGDDPLFGQVQPPGLSSETQRVQQAQVINNFVDSILAVNPNAPIVVLGDLNDFYFSNPLQTLAGSPAVLHDMITTLPVNERYTYIYTGNAQELDHILLSPALFNNAAPTLDVVHLNAEMLESQAFSDHDPLVVSFTLVPFGEADFTDLPLSYDVAWHRGPHRLWLGTGVNEDFSFAPNADAGDDGAERPMMRWTPGATVQIDVSVGGTGTPGWLTAWFDWNADGDFADPGERAVDQAVNLGANTVSLTIPSDAQVGAGSQATIRVRFRLYESVERPMAILLAPSTDGAEIGGEVEDYQWAFEPTAITLAAWNAHRQVFWPGWIGVLGAILAVGVFTFFGRRKRR